MPNRGSDVSINGSMAQCTAQAKDVAIPNPSQLTLIRIMLQRYYICNSVASFLPLLNTVFE